jgi:aspartyl-tRNA(Asn)/glutamyl-tRNA(Gln) amidotransferase subunit A
VPLATPDWEPGQLRSAFARDLGALGVSADVRAVFDAAIARMDGAFGRRIDIDFSDHDLARTRRAALLVMESELGVEFADDLADAAHPLSPRLRSMLVLPTVPRGPYPLADGERANDADLTAFASLAGCPAVSLPMGTLPDGMPIGLQLVGRPGADLRLLELAGICSAMLPSAPA